MIDLKIPSHEDKLKHIKKGKYSMNIPSFYLIIHIIFSISIESIFDRKQQESEMKKNKAGTATTDTN